MHVLRHFLFSYSTYLCLGLMSYVVWMKHKQLSLSWTVKIVILYNFLTGIYQTRIHNLLSISKLKRRAVPLVSPEKP